METSTLVFIVTIAVAFIFLRWLISPIPQSNEFLPDTSSLASSLAREPSSQSSSSNSQPRRRNVRPVTDLMVEVVQTIAPQLVREQIVYDLEKTGSVEITIENYMQNHSLPFPPGYQPPVSQPTKKEEKKTVGRINLIEKYQVDITGGLPEESPEDDMNSLLLKRKQRMILEARRKLEEKLNN